MKNDGLLGRCFLKGREGDAMNVLLAASGHNLRKLLAWLRSFWRWIPAAYHAAIAYWLTPRIQLMAG